MKNKKVVISLIGALMLATPLAFTYAKDGADDGPLHDVFEQKREEMQQQMEERHQEMEQRREELQQRFEEKRAELQDKRHQMIADILGRVVDRFQDAIDRLSGIADRIQNRIDVLDGEGVDVTVAQGHLDDAQNTLDDAQSTLNDIDPSALLDDFGTTTPSGPIGELRTQLGAVRDLLKKAHGQLIDAVSSMKSGLGKEGDESASSTDESEN